MARITNPEQTVIQAGIDADGYSRELWNEAQSKRGPGRSVSESAGKAPRSGRGVDTTIPPPGGKIPGKGFELGTPGALAPSGNPRKLRTGR